MERKPSVTLYVTIILTVCLILFPFLWVFLTSIRDPGSIFSNNSFFVANPTIESYVSALTTRPLLRYILNSLVVSALTTVLAIIVGSFAAYSLTKLPIKFKGLILVLILSSSMFPAVAIISPIFNLISDLNLRNSYFGLVIPYISISLPLSIWILSTFFQKIPNELLESAKLDGATPFQTFHKVILPLAGPGIATTSILVFIAAFHEYIFALTLNTDDAWRTVPVGITMFNSQYTTPWGDISAATIIVTIPILIIVLLFQRKIVSGLTAGAVKE